MRLCDRPEDMKRKMEKRYDVPNASNASDKAVTIIGTIELVVQSDMSTQIVDFVEDELTASAIAGFYFLTYTWRP